MATAGLRRSVVLKRRPHGEPTAADFGVQEDAIPISRTERGSHPHPLAFH